MTSTEPKQEEDPVQVQCLPTADNRTPFLRGSPRGPLPCTFTFSTCPEKGLGAIARFFISVRAMRASARAPLKAGPPAFQPVRTQSALQQQRAARGTFFVFFFFVSRSLAPFVRYSAFERHRDNRTTLANERTRRLLRAR